MQYNEKALLRMCYFKMNSINIKLYIPLNPYCGVRVRYCQNANRVCAENLSISKMYPKTNENFSKC